MLYALLIYADEKLLPAMPEPELRELFDGYNALNERWRADGSLQGATRLTDTRTATSLQVRDGRSLITDGPFAETKEQLAGLYLVECEDLDDALARAAQLPGASLGTVEVRPVHFQI